MVLLENNEEVVYVHCKKKNKRSESPAAAKVAPQPSEVVKLMDSQEEMEEIDSQVDLPQTGNVGGYHENEPADESNGGKTVVKGDQSPNLLEDDSTDSS
jgi:hypothetical protein